jgi:hypothetical protein
LFPQYDPVTFPSKYVGTGGKLVGEKRTNASNLSVTGIEGGTLQRISKGDYIFVPENTPRSCTKAQGHARHYLDSRASGRVSGLEDTCRGGMEALKQPTIFTRNPQTALATPGNMPGFAAG